MSRDVDIATALARGAPFFSCSRIPFREDVIGTGRPTHRG